MLGLGVFNRGQVQKNERPKQPNCKNNILLKKFINHAVKFYKNTVSRYWQMFWQNLRTFTTLLC